MCGIAGFLANLDKEISGEVLSKMLTRIQHRGPDESGAYITEGFVMGSVRLSIQDIKSGAMPISNEDRSLWIVYNGEIFNFIELREELIKKGYTFRTTGDTEVIVYLYDAYGIEFLKKLNGQFAISIWDNQKKELLLARDRLGIRPLYYAKKRGLFIFGSEMKAFLEYPGFEFELNPTVLSQYFTFWTSMNQETIFRDVFEVPPGSYLLVKEGQIKREFYWQIPIINPDEFKHRNLTDSQEELNALLEDSVRIRLRADVKVGAYLSGGLDSTLTTSYIHKLDQNNLRTFSIGFNDREYDESHYQQIASEFFGTKHTSIKIDEDKIAENYENAIWHSEAPLLRTSPVPMMSLSKAVKDSGIKVVITGEGADELFGGYNIFKETKIRQFWAKDTQSKYRPLLLKKLYPYLSSLSDANNMALRLFFGYKLSETNSPIYSHLIRWNNTSRIKNYFSNYVKSELGSYDPMLLYINNLDDKFNSSDYLSKASYIEMNLFLSGYLLSSQGDRMAMANSVEGRYPFLDHRVVEYALYLESDLKLKGLNEKYILKKMMKDKIPEQIITRSKQAYRAPVNQALWSEKNKGRFTDLLSQQSLKSSGLFDSDMVLRLLNKMENNSKISEIDGMALSGILSSELLNNLFVRKSKGSLNTSAIIKFDKIIIE